MTLTDETRAQVLDAARAAGRAAGRAYRDHGTIPKPPGSLTTGGLIVRQYATAWHHGFDEGRSGADSVGKSTLGRMVRAAVVAAYLKRNYPNDTLGWVLYAAWRLDPAVPLADIDMDRRPGGRDQKKVEGIARAIADGKPMDPVVLVDTGDPHDLQVADGYHRTLAYRHAGRTTIAGYVGSGAGEHGPWEREMHDRKLNKVGPKGYIHGWIFVGAPGVGAEVQHPQHGHGVVTHASSTHVAVRFDSGATHSFEAKPHAGGSPATPHLAPRPVDAAGEARPAPAAKYPVLRDGANDDQNRNAPDASKLKLAKPQRQALENYSAMDYLQVNEVLRTGGDDVINTPDTRAEIDRMTEVFRDAPRTTAPMTVTRGVHNADAMFGPPGSRVGKSFTDKAFVSTSTNTRVTNEFGVGETGSARLTIHVPPGSAALSMGALSVSPPEREVLLNRGSRFAVASDQVVDGQRQIELELMAA